MLLFPPAKINIGLHILRKRPDNYHDLELSFFELPFLCDVLEISPSSQDEFLCEGIGIAGPPQENLVVKALKSLRGTYASRLPRENTCRLHLLKNIPAGSGLGGGSADAAYTLKGLEQFLHAGISREELHEMAARIGSDCAFFLQGRACIGQGRGEQLHPLPPRHRENVHILVLVPQLAISTAEAYRDCHPQEGRPPLIDLLAQDMQDWKKSIGNDFEKSLFPKFPVLARIKQALYDAGAFYASLSGSGSALFGLFKQEADYQALAEFQDRCFFSEGDIAIP